MKKYLVSYKVLATQSIEIEAASKKEAKRKALHHEYTDDNFMDFNVDRILPSTAVAEELDVDTIV